ncbi:LIC10906 family membrane protein [Leptospira noguchii]|uniref:Membrane protein n=2 Tax=Leptospira noguchii TaxID=28182 RepID=A0ABP2T222_9LEPT|nr:histidine kinase N-terminal 7TM domain-containing protein [Leptospira noguchii]EMM98226.1 putative membrane protein [Leptospira noguchii str. 2007001578]EPE82885.1 putative membrane protein [Leptospira noguchii str. 1993005606]EQA73594.1 putative membrane protein [Leptospira noguchii serovar Panama str. CZ214]
MNLNHLIPVLAGFLHLFFGMYVFSLKPRQKLQTLFLFMNICMALWLCIQGLRGLFPLEYRNFGLNITFLPMSIATFIYYILCKKMENPDQKISIWIQVAGLIGFLYFTWASLNQKMVVLGDPNTFVFDFSLNYHLIIIFSVFWVALSAWTILKKMLVKRGNDRVRLFFVLLGFMFAYPMTLVFIYFLPFLGIYKAYLSSLGLSIGSICWAIAILHYDAFKIKAGLIQGQRVSFINRLASKPFLTLMGKLDPMRFIQKSSREKEELTKQILIQDFYLAENTGEISVDERAKILSKRFGKYFK